MEDPQLNYLAILTAAILNMAIGALWYSPLLFARPWMSLTGFKESDIAAKRKSARSGYAASTAASLVMAFILANFVQYTGARNFFQGAVTGLWCWLGFTAAAILPGYFFE